MAFTSITTTFVNGAVIDGPEVNVNFQDLVNGLSDSTKDINMNVCTFAGTATFNGAVTLGNGAADDITINGSLASSIPIKTTHSFDIGAVTLGLRDIYFGSSAGAFTTKVSGADVTASKTVVFWGYDVTLPTDDGTAGAAMITDGAGANSYQDLRSPIDVMNYSLTVAVDGSNGMDVTVKGSDGNDLSATNPMMIAFRDATNATGTPVFRTVTANITAKIDSGATLGHEDADVAHTHVYLIDNAGTVELAVSSMSQKEDAVITTVALGAGADTVGAIYSEVQRTNVAIKRIGHFVAAQATAGTWVTNPTVIYLSNNYNTLTEYDVTEQVSYANETTKYAVATPYETSYGWRVRWNMRLTNNSGTSSFDVTFAGIDISDTQTAISFNDSATGNPGRVTCNGNSIDSNFGSASTIFYLSGDCALDSKPVWAN